MKPMRALVLKSMINEIREEVIKAHMSIKSGKLTGDEARLIVDRHLNQAYGTRAGILELKFDSELEGINEISEISEITEVIMEWINEIVNICKDMDEHLILQESSNSEEEECGEEDLTDIFNIRDNKRFKMNKIDIREDSLRYGVATLINRAIFLYTELYIREIRLSENTARNYLTEYIALCEILSSMGIYNWIQVCRNEVRLDPSDIEIIK